jgi:hypothetical protein
MEPVSTGTPRVCDVGGIRSFVAEAAKVRQPAALQHRSPVGRSVVISKPAEPTIL